MSMTELCVLVVTFNRRSLLERCLTALARQSYAPVRVLVVDNASTDGTREWLASWLPTNLRQAKLLSLNANLGGAGGFFEGLRCAIETGADWVWMMDDDAEPHQDALSELVKVANDPTNVYGSLAVNGGDTSWLTTLVGPPQRVCETADDVPACAAVQSLPFLGFMIHRDLVAKIGLPDAGYFIAADDIEYCVRAQKAGAQIIMAGKSHIEHPKSRPYAVRLPGYTLTALELPPWKRYYDTRNRLLIARKYYGLKLITQTLPGSFVRLFAAMLHEPRKLAQLWAWCCGMFDGLLGIKGKRHQKWGILQ
jgi:GT2 family glycosyltransferase